MPLTSSYQSLLASAFFLGLAGSSFAIGAAFVSRWTAAGRQGTALGLYGLGTLGQSLAVFGGPVVAGWLGWQSVFRGTTIVLLVWAAVYAVLARNPPHAAKPATMAAMVALLRRSSTAWLLGAFYFLTFGGFVAFSIYLPTLLRTQFHLSPANAGFRAAGFVVLATLMRPVGGWLADRIGGAQVLSWVFGGVAAFSWLLVWPSMVPFTVGALTCAALLGLGNGAVFKLVPEHFPKDTGTVTGLVGALGGLGGFFPPLVLGAFKDTFGVLWPGFALLSATALLLRVANQRVFRPADVAWTQSLPMAARHKLERLRAGAWAALWTVALAAAIVVGSRRLEHFDAALVGYTFATLFAMFGITYRYAMWLHRPPTRMYWRRGWQVFLSRRGAWPPRHGARPPRARGVRRQPLHLPARTAAWARALADHVGLRARGRDHVPARLGLDSLRDRARRSPRVSHVRLRRSRAGLPRRIARSHSSSFTGWCGRRFSSSPA